MSLQELETLNAARRENLSLKYDIERLRVENEKLKALKVFVRVS